MTACAGCSGEFEQRRRDQRYCSATCRGRAARARAAGKADEQVEDVSGSAAGVERHGLVVTTYRELEAAGVLDTFDGQLALQLARRLANPDESGVSSLSKELRAVMAAALGSGLPAAGVEGQSSAPAEPDDEVTRARRARDEARQAAGGA